ncbi:hypothetical protein NW761_008415 [Fusarium oxysporum]|nr:hypothetical protein NW758_006587 [Fusarium oxysporum]KAJ4086794.1 hypothetical protein NW761_008415 [Fusarium oxysporum]
MAGVVPVDVDRRQGQKKKKAKVKTSGRTGATVSMKAKEVQTGTGADDEARVTPLHQPASAAELNSIEKRDTALEKELHQQLSRHVSTSQHAQPSDQGPVIDTTSKKHPDQSNNSTQHVTKGKGQSGDTKTTAATEPLVEGQPKTGESTVKADQDESQSQGTSSKPEEHKVAAPQVSVGGSPAISGRPVTRLLLTQTTDWDAWPEESPQDSAHQEPDICEPRRKATVEDVPDSGDEVASESERALASETLDRGLAAKKRQEKRNKRSRKIQKDKAIVEESMTSDSRPQFLLTYPGEGLGSEPSNPTPETKEDKAHAREAERRHRREERELERDRRNMSRMNVVFLNRMDMYWFCQVDIYQGFWATPWKPDVPIQTSLVGAVTVILEALLGFLEENVSLVYCDPNRYWTTRARLDHIRWHIISGLRK